MTSNFFSPLSFVAVFDPGSGMGKNQDPGSGILDKHPGSATLDPANLANRTVSLKNSYFFCPFIINFNSINFFFNSIIRLYQRKQTSPHSILNLAALLQPPRWLGELQPRI
jgi:hypothetical protein